MPETNFFWDPIEDNIIQERDDTGAITAEYTTEPGLYGNLISQNRGGVESQYHFDPHGSTSALTDDNQQVTDSYAYTAFGEVIEQSGGTLNPFQYVGREGYYRNFVSQTYLVRRRSASPSLARWDSMDPMQFADSSNVYCFVKNNPITTSDPSGLFSQELIKADHEGYYWTDTAFPSMQYNGPCASFYLATQWIVGERGDPEDGLIIQHVQVGLHENTKQLEQPKVCSGSPVTIKDICNPFPSMVGFNKDTTLACNNDYFEVWRVHKNKFYTRNVFEDEPSGGGSDVGIDLFAHFGFNTGTKGSYAKRGDAILIDWNMLKKKSSLIDELKKLFTEKTDTAPISAGNLYSACGNAPGVIALWQKLEKLSGKPVTHLEKIVQKRWNCCEKHFSQLWLTLQDKTGALRSVDYGETRSKVEPFKGENDPEPIIDNEAVKKLWGVEPRCDCSTK